ncbi:MAG TPA: type II toxin-antitoxin system RelE/ParE family toxin [Rhizomicrobium sp.]|jgi:phage-related protein|nr:type II toxin-antitoxin system RelE/ParE family toxin [Rhizomicrobium sp.]
MIDRSKRLRARFYETPAGGEPVRQWFKKLSPDDRKIVGKDVAKVEFGWPIGMPYCRPLGGGLWEVRSDISDGRITRVLFCIAGDGMILLHSFIKKTQRTPMAELELAKKRMREIKNG